MAGIQSNVEDVYDLSTEEDDAPEEVSFNQGKTEALRVQQQEKEAALKTPKRKKKQGRKKIEEQESSDDDDDDDGEHDSEDEEQESEDEEPDEETLNYSGEQISEDSFDEDGNESGLLKRKKPKTNLKIRKRVHLPQRIIEVRTAKTSVQVANKLLYQNKDPSLSINFKKSFLSDSKRVKRLDHRQEVSDFAKNPYRWTS